METTLDSGVAETGSAEDGRPGILSQLWQRRGVFALTFCAACAAVAVALALTPVSYVATGAVIVGDQEPVAAVPASSSAAWAQKVGDPADMESNLLLIRSPRLLRMLIEEPTTGPAVMAECNAAARQLIARVRPVDCSRLGDPEAELLWIQDRFSVSAVGRSRVIQVSYRSPVPQTAQTLVNGLIRIFLDDQNAKLLRPRDSAVEWVRARLQEVDHELRRDEAAIEDFRKSHGLVRGSLAPLTSERLTQAALRLSDAKAAEAEAALRVQELIGGPSSSRQVLESRTIADLKQQLAQTNALLANAAQRFGPRHPQLIAYQRQEAELNTRILIETARVADAARRNLDAARARVVSARAELEQATQAASQAVEDETQIASMVRQLDTKRATFNDLSQRLSQLETERRVLEANTQLVNMAELPTRPAFPQKVPFLAGGLTLASIVATAAAMVSYRPAASGPLALSGGFTRVPILSQVPRLRLRRTSAKELLGSKRDLPLGAALSELEYHSPLQESVRILHARLVLAGFGTTKRSLMITSEAAGEGKTFITMALARFATAAGRRVLVIESDMRRPFLSEALNAPPSAGLSGYLERGTLDVVRLRAVPGVDVIVSGDPNTSSTELLAGRRFRELLDWASRYDLVLVDSAPIANLMDPALIAPQVDGVLFCLRAGRPPTAESLNTLPELERTNGNLVGLVMTFVPDERVPMYRLEGSRSALTTPPLQAAA